MKYYITTIEQINQNGELAEYGTSEKVDSESLALSKYYKKLSDVAADIGKNHTYMDIKISNSYGSIFKSDRIGQYQEEAEPDSEEE